MMALPVEAEIEGVASEYENGQDMEETEVAFWLNSCPCLNGGRARRRFWMREIKQHVQVSQCKEIVLQSYPTAFHELKIPIDRMHEMQIHSEKSIKVRKPQLHGLNTLKTN